MLKTG